jgi:hypothetical protein
VAATGARTLDAAGADADGVVDCCAIAGAVGGSRAKTAVTTTQLRVVLKIDAFISRPNSE